MATKTIKELKYDTKATMIGKLVIGEKLEENKVSEKTNDKTGDKTTTIDTGKYKLETTVNTAGQTTKHRYVMPVGVEVNGSIHRFTLYGENMIPTYKKSIRIKPEGADETETIQVTLDKVEDYRYEANNAVWVNILEKEEIKSQFGEEVAEKGLKFVSNKALIEFLCKNSEKLNGMEVDIVGDVNINFYKGETSLKMGFLKSIKKSTNEYQSFLMTLPIHFQKNTFEKCLAKKEYPLICRLIANINEGGVYTDKFVESDSIHLSKVLLEQSDEVAGRIISVMAENLKKTRIVTATIELSKGSENSGEVELSETDKMIMEFLSDESKTEMINKIKKAKGVRGYAKEVANLLSIEPYSEIVDIKDSDYYVSAESVKSSTNTNSLKSMTATPPSFPTGM